MLRRDRFRLRILSAAVSRRHDAALSGGRGLRIEVIVIEAIVIEPTYGPADAPEERAT